MHWDVLVPEMNAVGRFNAMKKMDQIEEMSENNQAASLIDCGIRLWRTMREQKSPLFGLAGRLYDEKMVHFLPQKSV